MISIRKLDGIYTPGAAAHKEVSCAPVIQSSLERPALKEVSADNLRAYHPSFSAVKSKKANPSAALDRRKYSIIKSCLSRETARKLENLNRRGILLNDNSNDKSTVLDNLYRIVSEPRTKGLGYKTVLAETINALENPFSISQRFGDIPDRAAAEMERESGGKIPKNAKHVVSSSCAAANIEFNLASCQPAEFARFAADLSGVNYSVNKTLKTSDFAEPYVEVLWKLNEFNVPNKTDKNTVNIKIKPDKKAVLRAKLQTKYKDKGERSCVDVLMQSAFLNFGSQHTYDSITDERTGKFNPDKTGLTDFEINFTEQAVLGAPKYSAVYQDLDENGYLKGYHCTHKEIKQHILKSLALGQNVIIGYTHIDKNGCVKGGHEITITGYEPDKTNENGCFICNDTDDGIDEPVKMSEKYLIPLIHHAGISKEAFNQNDTVTEPWRDIINDFKNAIAQEKQNAA